MDIIVNTYKTDIPKVSREARDARNGLIEFYEKKLTVFPNKLKKGDKVFYVEVGFITGYILVEKLMNENKTEEITGDENYKGNCVLFTKCDTWQWTTPIKITAFQQFRYCTLKERIHYHVLGDWLTPRPDVKDLMY